VEFVSNPPVQRKVSLALRVCDPNKVNDAIGGISQGFVGVVATLKFKYARTVALGVSIGNQLRKPAGMYITPHLALLVPEEHRKWIPLVIEWACKSIAISIAWTIQAIISTVQVSTHCEGEERSARPTCSPWLAQNAPPPTSTPTYL